MASLHIAMYLLECDGCGKVFGAPNGYPSSTEARAVAYAEGWRFPNHVTKAGKAANSTSDVCPDCVPTWTPQRKEGRSRAISRDELLRVGPQGGEAR